MVPVHAHLAEVSEHIAHWSSFVVIRYDDVQLEATVVVLLDPVSETVLTSEFGGCDARSRFHRRLLR